MESLYARVGGEEVIDRIVTILYEKVRNDDLLAPFFEGIDMARQERKFRMFLHVVMGGPHNYSGLEVRAAHAPSVARGASETHMNCLLGHLRRAMESLDIDAALTDQILRRVSTYRADVLGE